MLIKILIAGDGGQGIQVISDILCQAAILGDKFVTYVPNYGLEQRGGVSLAYLKFSDEEVAYPRFSIPTILVILSEQARERTKKYQQAGVKILDANDFKNALAQNNIGPRGLNIFFLGLLAKMLEEKNICSTDEVYKLLEKKLSVKPGWEDNKKAFEVGKGIAPRNDTI